MESTTGSVIQTVDFPDRTEEKNYYYHLLLLTRVEEAIKSPIINSKCNNHDVSDLKTMSGTGHRNKWPCVPLPAWRYFLNLLPTRFGVDQKLCPVFLQTCKNKVIVRFLLACPVLTKGEHYDDPYSYRVEIKYLSTNLTNVVNNKITNRLIMEERLNDIMSNVAALLTYYFFIKSVVSGWTLTGKETP